MEYQCKVHKTTYGLCSTPGPADLLPPQAEVVWAVAMGSGLEGPKTPQSLAQARMLFWLAGLLVGRPLAEEFSTPGRGRKRGGKERGMGLTNAPLFTAVATIACNVTSGVGIFAGGAGKKAGKTPRVMAAGMATSWRQRRLLVEKEERAAALEGDAATKVERRTGLPEKGPGRGQNMTPGAILPGVQKSCQNFDSCPGSG
ncbi:hypothetical protein BY996DRAFT_8403419 [Phakopsora pachyrhizi]|nr:hypothetical protein BY996DRAFT_8403437 [Phakopsora pachyrhizi]KAI8442624.1 hypothetical protein BY996DRAFT_8403438 [Phakopsora pachyrhizi]KAI8442651.1 hypothetical protein BY996DRAFT_8403418 [Phakopsora pachyrhizi]KAI8442652.1 hypothetical protein BY996DRAFT_8403419 [Phakopsora pachyrhizi]